LAFITNIDGAPTVGIFDIYGNPLGIKNLGETIKGIDSALGSNSSNSSPPYVESLSQRIVDHGSWNSLTAQYSTLPFSASSGCWNIGNKSEASPYIRTLKVDNAVQEEYIAIIDAGGGPRPVVPDRKAPPCDCPPHIPLPYPFWGTGEWPAPSVEVKPETDCQPPRNNLEALINHKVYLFSGVHAGLSGIFALMPDRIRNPDLNKQFLEPWINTDPLWINDLYQEQNLLRGTGCWPPEALANAIGAYCTYRHDTLAYRGTGISDVGVSGINWKGYCKAEYEFEDQFYESRADCAGKAGYLYACDTTIEDGSISELTPTNVYHLEDSCDCEARHSNGRWSAWANYPHPVGGSRGRWVENSQPDWDASNDGDEIATKVYWTGAGCWTRVRKGGLERYLGEWDKTKLFAIVATGGGGPGAGDNIPPYWSDTECDWMYAIREVVAGDCTDLYHDITGCPTGPTIKIGLSHLHDAFCIDVGGSCPGIDWECCLDGAGDDPGTPGYCTAIQNRGSKYPNGDMVCYADGSVEVPGAEGQNWIVNNIPYWSGDADPVCNWIYDLQYYNPDIPGPSGDLQTGILESAISIGC